MTSCRSVLPVSALLVVGVLGMSACSREKPSGLAPFTPSNTNGSSSHTSSSPGPSPTSSSRWTPEQQEVIDVYDRFNKQVNAFWDKSQKIDITKMHRTAQEPFATTAKESLGKALSAGIIRSGAPRTAAESVTLTGRKATLKTCFDLTHTKLTNTVAGSRTVIETPPPSVVTVSFRRSGNSWLISDLQQGKAACARH